MPAASNASTTTLMGQRRSHLTPEDVGALGDIWPQVTKLGKVITGTQTEVHNNLKAGESPEERSLCSDLLVP